MPATLDPGKYSLWLSCTLPSPRPTWELMAIGSREELEQKKASLMPYTAKKRFAILQGTNPPRWQPRL
jgi:hypothetical protein